MDVNKTKRLVNAVCSLSNEDRAYEVEYCFERDEDDELLDIMTRPIGDQMWSRYYDRKRNYGGITSDIYHKRFKGRDEEALEKYRLEGLERIAKETDPLNKLDIFYEYARELKEDMKMLDYMECVYEETRALVSIEACSSMFHAGTYSLSEIKTILSWLKISDIYGLSKMLGLEIAITDDELEKVKEEYHKTGEPEVLKEMFGEPNNTGITMKDLLEGKIGKL